MKININQIITILILVMGAIGFFGIGNSIQKNGKPTIDFCYEHYHNKTFLKTMTPEDEPYEPLQCQSSTWRTGWYGLCNSTCFENYHKCLEENATKEQVKFSQNCHWMGPDYFILGGTLLFKGFFPLMCLGLVIAIIYSMFKEDKNVLQTCSGKSETE